MFKDIDEEYKPLLEMENQPATDDQRWSSAETEPLGLGQSLSQSVRLPDTIETTSSRRARPLTEGTVRQFLKHRSKSRRDDGLEEEGGGGRDRLDTMVGVADERRRLAGRFVKLALERRDVLSATDALQDESALAAVLRGYPYRVAVVAAVVLHLTMVFWECAAGAVSLLFKGVVLGVYGLDVGLHWRAHGGAAYFLDKKWEAGFAALALLQWAVYLVHLGQFLATGWEGACTLVGLSQLFRPYLLVAKVAPLRQPLATILRTLAAVAPLLALAAVAIAFYAALATSLFNAMQCPGYDPEEDNFDTFWPAVMAMYVLTTTENFPMVAEPAFAARGNWAFPFFLSFLGLFVLILLPLLLAQILSAYRDLHVARAKRSLTKARRGLLVAYYVATTAANDEEGGGDAEDRGEGGGGGGAGGGRRPKGLSVLRRLLNRSRVGSSGRRKPPMRLDSSSRRVSFLRPDPDRRSYRDDSAAASARQSFYDSLLRQSYRESLPSYQEDGESKAAREAEQFFENSFEGGEEDNTDGQMSFEVFGEIAREVNPAIGARYVEGLLGLVGADWDRRTVAPQAFLRLAEVADQRIFEEDEGTFGPQSAWETWCKGAMKQSWFHIASRVLTLAFFGMALLWQQTVTSDEVMCQEGLGSDEQCRGVFGQIALERLLVALYGADIAIRMGAEGKGFWRSPWNKGDFAIMIFSVFAELLSLINQAYFIENMHFGDFLELPRSFRVLRMVVVFTTFRDLMDSISPCTQVIAELVSLYLCVTYSFAAGGEFLFRDVRATPEDDDQVFARYNFEDFTGSLLCLLYLSVSNNWNDLMYHNTKQTSRLHGLYFVAYMVFCSTMILDIIVGVVIEAYAAAKKLRRRSKVMNAQIGQNSEYSRRGLRFKFDQVLSSRIFLDGEEGLAIDAREMAQLEDAVRALEGRLQAETSEPAPAMDRLYRVLGYSPKGRSPVAGPGGRGSGGGGGGRRVSQSIKQGSLPKRGGDFQISSRNVSMTQISVDKPGGTTPQEAGSYGSITTKKEEVI